MPELVFQGRLEAKFRVLLPFQLRGCQGAFCQHFEHDRCWLAPLYQCFYDRWGCVITVPRKTCTASDKYAVHRSSVVSNRLSQELSEVKWNKVNNYPVLLNEDIQPAY